MYYFVMKKDSNINQYDFFVDIKPRFKKIDRELLIYFLENAEKNDKFTEIDYHFTTFNMSYENLVKTINDIKKSSINVITQFEGKTFRNQFINFFDTIFFENNKIIYKLSKEVFYDDISNNFINKIYLLIILKINNIYHYNFLKLILKKYELKNEIIFSVTLSELKKALNIPQDKYERFYDFENKLLKPMLKNFNKLGISIYFEKIKEKDGKNARIIGIEIKIINF